MSVLHCENRSPGVVASMTILIIALATIGVLVVGGFVMSRRSKAVGGEDRAQRRRETIADNPALDSIGFTTSGLFGQRRKNVKNLIADVARDSVDRPNGASSDDLDLLARRPPAEET